MRCITLEVYSDFKGVGLKAAVANALAENNIPCDIIANYSYHYAFVYNSLVQTLRGSCKAYLRTTKT